MRIAVGIWIAVMLLAWFDGPVLTSSHHEEVDHCAQDPTGNHVVDIADLAEFTGVFGSTTPHLDIFPEMAPNGWVDTGDITAVTARFGGKCYGFQGSEPITINPFGAVVGCQFKAEAWWKETHGNLAIVQPMAGITGCLLVGFSGAYSAICSLQMEARAPDGSWYVVDGTGTNGTSWMANGVLRCTAENYAAVGVPMYTAMREKMCHQIWRDGVGVHGWHCHVKPSEFFLPCDPSRPEMC